MKFVIVLCCMDDLEERCYESWYDQMPKQIFVSDMFERFSLHRRETVLPGIGVLVYEDGHYAGNVTEGTIRPSFWCSTQLVRYTAGDIMVYGYEPHAEHPDDMVDGVGIVLTCRLEDPRAFYESGSRVIPVQPIRHMLSDVIDRKDAYADVARKCFEDRLCGYFDGLRIDGVQLSWSTSDELLAIRRRQVMQTHEDALMGGRMKQVSEHLAAATRHVQSMDAPASSKLLMLFNMNALMQYTISGSYDTDAAREILLSEIRAEQYPEYVRVVDAAVRGIAAAVRG